MKLPEPDEPNSVAEAPAPNEAPMSAPLPCCNIIRPISPIAASKKIIKELHTFELPIQLRCIA